MAQPFKKSLKPATRKVVTVPQFSLEPEKSDRDEILEEGAESVNRR
jgi:hypothetical protein